MFLGEFVGIEIRDYQQKLIDDIGNAFGAGHRRVMAQLATGGGKTVIFAWIAGHAVAKGKRVLILAHTEELVFQAAEKLSTLTPFDVGIIKAGHKPNLESPIQVASVQTMVNRLEFHEHFDLIIIDEAHHSPAPTYQTIVNNYPAAKILGMTATVWRLDNKGFADYFDTLVVGPPTKDLINRGYLSRFNLYIPPPDKRIVTDGLKTDKFSGNYLASDLERVNNMERVNTGVIETYREHVNGKQGIVFAFSVEHSEQIAALYTLEGIPAAHLDGTTPKGERLSVLQKFRNKEIGVICNYGLFSEGLDIPGLDFVQVLRPTQSLIMWLQICGRALRPHEGKEIAAILDHTNNWSKHGLPHLDRNWTLDPLMVKTKEEKEVVGGEKIDPEKEKPAPDLNKVDDPLIELKLNFADDPWAEQLRLLIITEKARGRRFGWVCWQLRKLKAPLHIWEAYAEYLGYKKGWGWYQWKEQDLVQVTS